MASVSSYETSKGRRYRVRFREGGKQVEQGGFRTKRDAQLRASEVELTQATNTYVSPAASRTTVGELGPPWLERRATLKPSTVRTLESCWRVHVEPRWGTTKVSQVEFTDIQAWVTSLSTSGSSATTVKRALGVLNGILGDAMRDKRLTSNPCVGIRTPRKVSKERVFLDHSQLRSLATEAGQHGTFVLVLGYCGLRWGEAIGLRVKDIDFRRNRINVERNAVEVGSQVHVGTPKSHERRSVPFPTFLSGRLQDMCRSKLPNALVFAASDGDFMRRARTDEASGSWFAGAVRRAGIPRVTPHDLRHTAASLAISAGANVKAVQKMLGHASAAMTLDVYSGLFDDDLDAVAQALNQQAAALYEIGSA